MSRMFAGTPFDIPPKCDRCGLLESECHCTPLKNYLPPDKQTACIRVEKRPKGKVVTVISGLSSDSNDLPALLTTLKNACGAGGACKDSLIEIQGDHASRVKSALEKIGYRL